MLLKVDKIIVFVEDYVTLIYAAIYAVLGSDIGIN